MTKDYVDEHFQIYNIIDRLRDICIRKYGYIGKASKAFGSRNLNKYLSSNAYSLGFNLLKRLCKFLDISFQYAVFGVGDKKYVEQTITYNNFYKEYKKIYKGNTNRSVYRNYWRGSASLKYLIDVARKSGKTIDYLIGG